MRWVPTFRGVIDRRILVNFAVEPAALDPVLPDRFRPRTVDGPAGERAIGGVCCIRLTAMRPRGLPAAIGVTAENAAHRIGVEWEGDDGETRSGVYVPRRDTSSRLVSVFGSRSFGRHHHADFAVSEGDGRYQLRMANVAHDVTVEVDATATDGLPEGSVFPDLAAASAYHECGAVGYCPTPSGDRLAGVELATDEWHVEPLSVASVRASFFEQLPDDAVAFDNALLMRDIGHEWRPRRSFTVEQSPPPER
ncbi:DUF2071 domain-containing protein [Haloarchaeobius salinus]|uniref:DUF2071 domain-containing protein n=1 Tax=Haloarchaeobius salinus TaxID=1198298 RepID=UPI0021098A8B|nr:DUF2071 domain-containing protein [Haloarchaeobius salinus]